MSFNFRRKDKKWIMTRKVLDEIRFTIGTRTPEWGGILGSSDGIRIDHYYFDKTALRNGGSYTMDTETLNRVIKDWNDADIKFIGVIHSHPNGITRPSAPDAALAERIIETMDMGGEIFTPIVQVSPELNGNIRIYPYTFSRSVRMIDQPLVFEKKKPLSPEEEELREADKKAPRRFSRIENSFPSHIMKNKAVICVGCGGSRDFILSLARCGVSAFYLYDKDKVEDTNIATQGAFVSEIGKLKVEVIKKLILDINPRAEVYCIPEYLDDNITDEEFALTAGISSRPAKDIILCGCTDNANAQMRCELLSRKFSIPYLAAQVYAGGKGHELVFTYPSLTESCCMCMLGTRYKKIYSRGLDAGGSSEGTSVWVTNNLNSIKTYLALCILCYDDPDTLYFRTLEKYADRNYFMSKCHESFTPPAFEPIESVFEAETDLSLPAGTVAIEQTPEKNCPVCEKNKSAEADDTITCLHNIINILKDTENNEGEASYENME